MAAKHVTVTTGHTYKGLVVFYFWKTKQDKDCLSESGTVMEMKTLMKEANINNKGLAFLTWPSQNPWFGSWWVGVLRAKLGDNVVLCSVFPVSSFRCTLLCRKRSLQAFSLWTSAWALLCCLICKVVCGGRQELGKLGYSAHVQHVGTTCWTH